MSDGYGDALTLQLLRLDPETVVEDVGVGDKDNVRRTFRLLQVRGQRLGRLGAQREREIEQFVAQQYWSVTGLFEQGGTPFRARLARWRGDKVERLSIKTEADARAAEADIQAGKFTVTSVETKPLTRNPPPPFTTSTLQQEAARKLGLNASRTMQAAQRLYEAGHITYMRTDGVTIEEGAIRDLRNTINAKFGKEYAPPEPRRYSSKIKNAQEAHEAVRGAQAMLGGTATVEELVRACLKKGA